MKDNKTDIAALIPILQAYVDGKRVQCQLAASTDVWRTVSGPMFSLLHNKWRVADAPARKGVWSIRLAPVQFQSQSSEEYSLVVEGFEDEEPMWPLNMKYLGKATFTPKT